jgi:hypothetical protein
MNDTTLSTCVTARLAAPYQDGHHCLPAALCSRSGGWRGGLRDGSLLRRLPACSCRRLRYAATSRPARAPRRPASCRRPCMSSWCCSPAASIPPTYHSETCRPSADISVRLCTVQCDSDTVEKSTRSVAGSWRAPTPDQRRPYDCTNAESTAQQPCSIRPSLPRW